MAKLVVGLFDTVDQANHVVAELEARGFRREDINLVGGGKQRIEVVSGAGEGAAIGGGLGLVAGLAALAIPGVGPVIAAGPVAVALTGAGFGAAAGGLLGALNNMGIPEEDAPAFLEGIKRGAALVSLRADSDDDAERAADVMDDNGSLDIDERRGQWIESHLDAVDPDPAAGALQVERRAADREPLQQESSPFEEAVYEFSETVDEPVVHKRTRVAEEIVVRREPR